jgi:hypothetical protein
MKRALVASLLAVLPLLVHAGRNNRSGVRDMPPKLRAWMRRQPADELRGLARWREGRYPGFSIPR